MTNVTSKPFQLSVIEIMRLIGGTIANEEHHSMASLAETSSSYLVSNLSNLSRAQAGDCAFFFSPKFKNELLGASPSVLVTGLDFVAPLRQSGLPIWKKSIVVSCPDPYRAMATLSQIFYLEEDFEVSIHPQAYVSDKAILGEGVQIGAFTVVEAGARIGAGSRIYPHCYIGKRVIIGEQCVLYSNVSIYPNVSLGRNVRLHSGVVIGADGFGYAQQKVNDDVVSHQKIWHLGGVRIGNDVEIGANSCVDRGTLEDTIIEDHVKIDNLVQAAHNCKVGEGSILCGTSGMAGSSSLGKYVFLGGGAAINNGVHIGDRAMIGPVTSIAKNIPPKGIFLGMPQRQEKDHRLLQVLLNRMLDDYKEKKQEKKNRIESRASDQPGVSGLESTI